MCAPHAAVGEVSVQWHSTRVVQALGSPAQGESGAALLCGHILTGRVCVEGGLFESGGRMAVPA